MKKYITWLVTISIGSSAIRNQGNGIADPIRKGIISEIALEEFIKALKHKNPIKYSEYLDKLTSAITGIKGDRINGKPGTIVKWGTARKCINLVARTIVYNGFIWEEYGIKSTDFTESGFMNKLELPVDSYVVKRIKNDCEEYDIDFDSKKYNKFSIVSTKKVDNAYYQDKANEIAKKKNVCRIKLDEGYWRNLEDSL